MDKLKNVGFWTIFFVFLALMTNNTKKQIENLINARKENNNLEGRIEIQTKTNSNMERKIKYATESAYFIEQQAREKFGLGRENDYWVEINYQMMDLFPEIQEMRKVSIIKQWWNLFTK